MLSDLFKKPKYVTVKTDTERKNEIERRDIPDGLWTKCPKCNEIIYNKELEKNSKVCVKCSYHFKLTARERISLLLDENSFLEFDNNLTAKNPLEFEGYQQKIPAAMEKTGLNEAVITGEGKVDGLPIIIACMDFAFMGGSMGSVVGEKICRAIEKAIEKQCPILIASTSGGARMQEGIISLMQMAKTSAAIARLSKSGILYISLFTDPTSGGVTASFASIGDIILAEPDALICFAGPRVIEQTIRQKLPPGAQRAEFLVKHGMIDKIVDRRELKKVLATILEMHQGKAV